MIDNIKFIDQYDELLNDTGSVYDAMIESLTDSENYCGGSEMAALVQKCEKSPIGTAREAALKMKIADKIIAITTDELSKMAQEMIE